MQNILDWKYLINRMNENDVKKKWVFLSFCTFFDPCIYDFMDGMQD